MQFAMHAKLFISEKIVLTFYLIYFIRVISMLACSSVAQESTYYYRDKWIFV